MRQVGRYGSSFKPAAIEVFLTRPPDPSEERHLLPESRRAGGPLSSPRSYDENLPPGHRGDPRLRPLQAPLKCESWHASSSLVGKDDLYWSL